MKIKRKTHGKRIFLMLSGLLLLLAILSVGSTLGKYKKTSDMNFFGSIDITAAEFDGELKKSSRSALPDAKSEPAPEENAPTIDDETP